MLKFISSLLVFILPLSFSYSQTNIAVLPLEGNGISSVEAKALTDQLALELFATGYYKVLERGNMEAILKEQNFQLSGCVSEECVIEVGSLLGVESIVAGSVSKFGSTYTIGLRLINVETGELIRVASYDHQGAIDQLLSVGIPSVAQRLAGQETIASPNPSDQASDPSTKPIASTAKGDERPRTWSINVGLGSSRNANFSGISKDIIAGRHFSLYITAGLGLELYGAGIAFQSHYNAKGPIYSSSIGVSILLTVNHMVGYQWPLGRRGFLVAGAAFGGFDFQIEVVYPVLSYEYRF